MKKINFFRFTKKRFFEASRKSDFCFRYINYSGRHEKAIFSASRKMPFSRRHEKVFFFGFRKIAYSERHDKPIFFGFQKIVFHGAIKMLFFQFPKLEASLGRLEKSFFIVF
jgi:hypothetical protein